MNRSLWVDNAKGIAIALVVVGHVIAGLFVRDLFVKNDVWQVVYDWVYLFHMPVFFLVSGFFVFKSADKGFGRFIDGKVRRIVYPYFLWTLIQWLAIRFAGGGARTDASANALLVSPYQPFMKFWFFYTLFMLMMLAAVCSKLPMRRILMIAIAVALYAMHGMGWLEFWQVTGDKEWRVLNDMGRFAIYFAFGAALGPEFLAWVQERKALLPKLAIPAFGFMTGLFFMVDTASPWVRPIVALLGIVGTIGAAQAVSLWTKDKPNFITTMGVYSLEIYLVHSLVIGIGRVVLMKATKSGEVLLFLLTVASILGSILLAVLLKKAKFPYLFYIPSPKGKAPPTDTAK